MVKRICQFCKTPFYTKPCEIKKGGGKFCSRYCCDKDKKGKKRKPFSKKWKENMSKVKIGIKLSKETKIKMSKSRRGDKNPKWNNGIKIDKNGYLLQYIPQHPYARDKKYVGQSRLVIEKQIGRYLKPKETVHHLNRIKADNRPENLMAFSSHSAHMRFERGGKVKPKEIIFDGKKINHNPTFLT